MDTNELDRLAAEVKSALTHNAGSVSERTAQGNAPAECPRLVTEEYVRAAHIRGETVVRVVPGAVITPLAKDALALYRMAVASALATRATQSPPALPAASNGGEPGSNRKRVAGTASRAAGTATHVAVGVVATAKVEPLVVETLRRSGQSIVRVQGSSRKAGHLARSVAGTVASGQADWGVVVDETGLVGAAIANRVKGVRAACCNDTASAKSARERLAANVLCMGADIVAPALMREIVTLWIATPPSMEPETAALLDGLGE
jgi:RpiB/LacA/LacB family sugar-phosphate isomerase